MVAEGEDSEGWGREEMRMDDGWMKGRGRLEGEEGPEKKIKGIEERRRDGRRNGRVREGKNGRIEKK